MNFKDMAEQNETWIIEQRRYFHAHPELSFEEKIRLRRLENAWKKWVLHHIFTRITTVSGQ